MKNKTDPQTQNNQTSLKIATTIQMQRRQRKLIKKHGQQEKNHVPQYRGEI